MNFLYRSIFILALLFSGCDKPAPQISTDETRNSVNSIEIRNLKKNNNPLLSTESNISLKSRIILNDEIANFQAKIAQEERVNSKKNESFFSVSFNKIFSKNKSIGPQEKNPFENFLNDDQSKMKSLLEKVQYIQNKSQNYKKATDWFVSGMEVVGISSNNSVDNLLTGIEKGRSGVDKLIDWSSEKRIDEAIKYHFAKDFSEIPKASQEIMFSIIKKNKKNSPKTMMEELQKFIKSELWEKEQEELRKSKISRDQKDQIQRSIIEKKANTALDLFETYGENMDKIHNQLKMNEKDLNNIKNILTVKGVLLNQASLIKIKNLMGNHLKDFYNKSNKYFESLDDSLSKIDDTVEWLAEYDFNRGTKSEKIIYLRGKEITLSNEIKSLKEKQKKYDSNSKEYADIEKEINKKKLSKNKLKDFKDNLRAFVKADEAIPIGKMSQVVSIVNNLADSFNLPKDSVKDINNAFKVGKAVSMLWKIGLSFSGNPFSALAALSSIKKMFSSAPDPNEVRHREIMANIQKIISNQRKIIKTIQKIEKKVTEYQQVEISKIYDIQEDINFAIRLQKKQLDKEVLNHCPNIFVLNMCERDSVSGIAKTTDDQGNRNNCEYKSDPGQTTFSNYDDFTSGKITKFRSFDERVEYFRLNRVSKNLGPCLKGIKNNLSINKLSEALLYLKSSDYPEDIDEQYDYGNSCFNKHTYEGVTDNEKKKRCINRFFQSSYFSLNNYFSKYYKQSYRNSKINSVLKSLFVPTYHFDFLNERKRNIEVNPGDWSSYSEYFYDPNKETAYAYPFNNKFIMYYSRLGLETLIWSEISRRKESMGDFSYEIIEDPKNLSKHVFEYRDHLEIFENSTRWLNLAIASEVLISGEPLLEIVFNNFFYNFIKKDKKIKISKEIIDFSLKSNCATSNQVGDAYCVLMKNPLLRKNFINYALNKLLIRDHSLILYQIGLSEEGDSSLLSQSIMLPLSFHYEPLNKQTPKMNTNAPRGWSVKIQSTFTPLPTTDEILKSKIHYRSWLHKLVRLRDEISYAHSGLLMEQGKSAFDNDDKYALSKKEREIIHKKALLP